MTTGDRLTPSPVAWFVANPVAANLIMALIIVVGIVTARGLPRESFPGFPPKTVTIEVFFPSGSPEITEEGIVLKLEQALQGTSGIQKISSLSRGDGATLTIEKTPEVDLDQLLADVKARVDAVPNLPPRAERPVIRKETREEQVLWTQVSGNVGRDVLEAIAHDLWRDLQREPGIDRVERVGHRDPEVHIEIADAHLAEHGLTLEQVAAAIDRESLIDLSGQLRDAGGSLMLRTARQSYWASEFADLVLSTRPDGTTLTLGDIASIEAGYHDSSHVWMRYQGLPSIGLRILKEPGASTDRVSQAVQRVIARWQQGHRLPKGVRLDAWNDLSEQITSRVGLLLGNALIGMVLVFAILALTLDLRVAVWVAMGLPVSFGGAFLVMDRFGLSLNDLTTFGMIVALGLVVDDAVVVGESIHATQRQLGSSLASTVRGVHRVAVPTIFGVLTTVAAFSVLGLVKGDFGLVFSQFALVTAGCLLFSLLESKLILPAHLAHLRPGDRPGSRLGRQWARVQNLFSRAFDRLTVHYKGFLEQALKRRYLALGGILVLTAITLGLVASGWVRSTFFPDIPGELVTATLEMEDSAGFGLTERNLARLEASLERTGRRLAGERPLFASIQTHMTGDRTGEVKVELTPHLETLAPRDIADAWRLETGHLEGAETLIFSADFDAFPAISLEVSASEEASLAAAHGEILAGLREIPGVRDVRDNLSPGRSELQLELTAEGRALGLTTGRLADQIQRAFLGYEVQRFQRGPDEVRVRVRYPESDRSSPGDLTKARVRLPSGEAVPLSQVASARFRAATASITRVDGRRVSTIDADVDRAVSSPEEVFARLEEELLPALRSRYPDIEIRQEGELAEIAETTASIALMLALALASIYALIAIPLKSYTQPILIMAVIPFGILGAILGHWIHGLPMSILSFFGLLALSGIVVNDSLLLVALFNRRRQAGDDPPTAWINAGSQRLRAIVLTSITTFAGLAPLILETNEHAQYLIPAAVSIAYGILLATGITLIILPVFQVVADDARRVLGRWLRPAAASKPVFD
ncbi:MAG: efflux RND transporter permease subunit [Acidobacteriota bacterium]